MMTVIYTDSVCEQGAEERMFGPERGEVIGGWRKLHDEGLCDFHSSPSIIRRITSRRMKLARHVACMESKNAYIILVKKPEGKRKQGRSKRRWVNNIKMNLT
jgi:hypothetical protein